MSELSSCDQIIVHVKAANIVGGLPPLELTTIGSATGLDVESFDIADGSLLAVLSMQDALGDAARIVGYCAVMAGANPERTYEVMAVDTGRGHNIDLSDCLSALRSMPGRC